MVVSHRGRTQVFTVHRTLDWLAVAFETLADILERRLFLSAGLESTGFRIGKQRSSLSRNTPTGAGVQYISRSPMLLSFGHLPQLMLELSMVINA